MQHLPQVTIGQEPMRDVAHTPNSKLISPEQGEHLRAAKITADKLFDLIGVRSPGEDPKPFIAAVVSLMSNYPPHVLRQALDPFYGIPGRRSEKMAWEAEIEFYKKVLDELRAPSLREEERERAAIEARRQRMLPPPPRTAEQQARIDKQVAETRRALGIPVDGLPPREVRLPPSADLPINAPVPASFNDGKHALRIADDLAMRRTRNGL